MASITIRNIDERVKKGLRLRAAANGRSMEEEARRLLAESIRQPDSSRMPSRPTMSEALKRVQKLVQEAGGIDLPAYEDEYVDFDELFATGKPDHPSRAA
jgi:plasmid stability protein